MPQPRTKTSLPSPLTGSGDQQKVSLVKVVGDVCVGWGREEAGEGYGVVVMGRGGVVVVCCGVLCVVCGGGGGGGGCGGCGGCGVVVVVESHSFVHVWTTTQEAPRPAQQGGRSLCPATRESLGHKDHGDLPLRNDRDDDYHEEL